MKSFLAALILFCTALSLKAQHDKLSMNGYVSSLQTSLYESFDGYWQSEQMIHNRLNFNWYPSSKLTFTLEMRNRIISGDMVKNPAFSYADILETDPGWLDLSWNIMDETSVLWNSMLDRAYLLYSNGKLDVQLGRQRINWGQTFVWNPNDIFNAYSFFDFDYIERPGSDALRFIYYPTYTSAFETAVKVNREGKITAAGLYRFNAFTYDFQLLMGIMDEQDYVIGTGWSGAIKYTSFRGEFTYFQAREEASGEEGMAMLSLSADHTFANSNRLQVELLLSSKAYSFDPASGLLNTHLSIKQQAFSKYALMSQYNWQISPLWTLGISGIYYPDLEGFFAGPSLQYSLTNNLDFSIRYQHFNADFAGQDRSKFNLLFLRFKQRF